MQHYAWFRQVLKSAIRRIPAGQWRETAMRHWCRSCALVIGTALGLFLAVAPPAARSAPTDNQLPVNTGDVGDEITVNGVTRRICSGPICACQSGEMLLSGGAQCAARDTLRESFPLSASIWQASCQHLLEIRGSVVTTGQVVVLDIIRTPAPPASTSVLCATP